MKEELEHAKAQREEVESQLKEQESLVEDLRLELLNKQGKPLSKGS